MSCFYPHWPRNSQGKNGTYPVMTPAIDYCDGVKTGHINFAYFFCCCKIGSSVLKEECLVVFIIKKKFGNDKAL